MNSVKTASDILMMILPACSGITYLKLVSHQTISPLTKKSADFSRPKKSADFITDFFSRFR